MFCERLLALIAERGMSEAQFLREVNMGENQITLWKKGRRPRRSTICRIAAYFDLPVTYFMDETNNEGQTKNSNISAFDEQLLSMFHGTTDAGRMRIIQAVMNICEEEEKKASEQDTDAIV